jgi:hypothetical protein
LVDLNSDGYFLSVQTKYLDYRNEQGTVAVPLRLRPASESHDMRSTMFAANYLVGTGVQDSIAAVGRTKMHRKTASTQQCWSQFHA